VGGRLLQGMRNERVSWVNNFRIPVVPHKAVAEVSKIGNL